MTTTITILTPVPTAGALIAEEACTELGENITFTLAPAAMKVIGPFEPRYWNDANGYIQITYDAVTDLVLRAIRVTG